MPSPGYMTINNSQGQTIKSIAKVKGREEMIEVLDFHHGVYIPTNMDTGSPSGPRKHKPFKIRKVFCSASPELYKACCSGETLESVALNWYRINEQGNEELYFSHALERARIITINALMPHAFDQSAAHFTHEEEVSFSYEKMTWTYADGNITTYDTWLER